MYTPNRKEPRTVKDLDPEDQPRERACRHGCHTLSVPDLWAIILRTGTPGNPITELCRDLMDLAQGRLHTLERKTRREIQQLKGIGLTKSIQIEAVMELMKRYAAEEPICEQPLTSSQVIYNRLKFRIGNLDHEEIWLLLLNRRNQVIREVCLSQGTATASIFDVKAAIKHAILENAEALILAHNHPSGNLLPSEPDNRITRDLKQAATYMNIKMLDHVIVTADGYFSYHDSGRL